MAKKGEVSEGSKINPWRYLGKGLSWVVFFLFCYGAYHYICLWWPTSEERSLQKLLKGISKTEMRIEMEKLSEIEDKVKKGLPLTDAEKEKVKEVKEKIQQIKKKGGSLPTQSQAPNNPIRNAKFQWKRVVWVDKTVRKEAVLDITVESRRDEIYLCGQGFSAHCYKKNGCYSGSWQQGEASGWIELTPFYQNPGEGIYYLSGKITNSGVSIPCWVSFN